MHPAASRARAAACAILAVALAVVGAPSATAEQAGAPSSPHMGMLDAGAAHSCAFGAGSAVRCWGFGAAGQLGYGSAATVGDDETPATMAPLHFGAGRTAQAIAAGDHHSCALLDDAGVRCWGFGGDGRLGYANSASIGDDEPAGAGGPVFLGPGRTATAITAGTGHTCALLDDRTVRCWGFGGNGRLGYGSEFSIGDDETPGSAGPVNLGPGRTARAISAGGSHTCALLDDGSVRCWGYAVGGRLGYGDYEWIGDDELPGSVGPVDLGSGRTATAITTGSAHSCAILDDGTVRCWGYNHFGQLGIASTTGIGDNEPPSAAAALLAGTGGAAVAISAGDMHTCAVLNDGGVRCWGWGTHGRLGYATTQNIGDDELGWAAGAVDLGPGRTATAVSAGVLHTCARLDDGAVRCWGHGGSGRLGRCSAIDIGDNEPPSAVAPVNLDPPDIGCAAAAAGGSGVVDAPVVPPAARTLSARDAERLRARGWRRCVARAKAAQTKRARAQAMRRCRRLWARTPGRVTKVRVRARSRSRIVLEFSAPGTHRTRPPAARRYLVKQSLRPIRGRTDFRRADKLCGGSCRFAITRVGSRVRLEITDLRPRTTYYYAVAAYDNVSGRAGPRSATAAARTRSR
jgi:alpha-tubulin suppressor-like RCC1 family protein